MQAAKALMIKVNVLTRRSLSRVALRAFPSVSSVPPLASTAHFDHNNRIQIHQRCFHATPTVCLAVRRRRRRGDSGEAPKEEDSDMISTYEEHLPLSEPTLFEEKGQELLAKLGKAVEPMIPLNDPFDVTRTHHMLKIEVGKAMGSYELELEPEERIVVLRSPISGAHSYFYSQRKEEWVDTVDFHSLEGIFVRDLIRHCRGMPKL